MRKFAVLCTMILHPMQHEYRDDPEPIIVEAQNAELAFDKVAERLLGSRAYRHGDWECRLDSIWPFEDAPESVVPSAASVIQRLKGFAEGFPGTVNHEWNPKLTYIEYMVLLDLLENVARGLRYDELKDALELPPVSLE